MNRLKKYKIDKKLTYADIAKGIDRSVRAVIKYCRNERIPEDEALENLNKFTGIKFERSDFREI